MTVVTNWQVKHFTERHQCCWIADPDEYTQCGLWCGHDGDHSPHTPGEYLRAPLLHPMDVVKLLVWGIDQCPLCGTPVAFDPWANVVTGWYCEGPIQVWRLTGPPAWAVGPEWQWEHTWRFEPCGCEGRELLTNPNHDPS